MRITYFILLALLMPILAHAAPPTLKTEQAYREDAHRICAEKWTKRGELDRRMYNHCMEQQADAYKDLVQLHQYANQSFYSDVSFPYCSSRWTNRGVVDTRMIVHCLNQEVEGVKDVMYYRDQYGADQVNKIAAMALTQFKSWNMAAYKVKQHFD